MKEILNYFWKDILKGVMVNSESLLIRCYKLSIYLYKIAKDHKNDNAIRIIPTSLLVSVTSKFSSLFLLQTKEN